MVFNRELDVTSKLICLAVEKIGKFHKNVTSISLFQEISQIICNTT